ncbi:hypothetical protein A2U01_0053441, partial [Trifolium medium]|nr:hypothetical protein [Trifolium medium]
MCMNTLVGQDDLVLLILESLSCVLSINEEEYAQSVDLGKIKLLKETRNGELSDTASSMIVRFWHDDVDDEGDALK